MKDQYKWNYNIKIKTKEGTYEYEKEDLTDIDLILMKHPKYDELRATQCKHKEHTEKVKKLGTMDKK